MRTIRSAEVSCIHMNMSIIKHRDLDWSELHHRCKSSLTMNGKLYRDQTSQGTATVLLVILKKNSLSALKSSSACSLHYSICSLSGFFFLHKNIWDDVEVTVSITDSQAEQKVLLLGRMNVVIITTFLNHFSMSN